MADDGIDWEGFKDILADLFLVKGKTLIGVKTSMERDHGFPAHIPLSIYQTRLRDRLGLRKNLTSGDWTIVYQYVQARRLSDFDLYFHGAHIPRSKMRKNFSRYHCKEAIQLSNLAVALPHGLEVRLPQTATCAPNTPDLPSGGTPRLSEIDVTDDVNMTDASDMAAEVDLQTSTAADTSEIVPFLGATRSPGAQSDGILSRLQSLPSIPDWNAWGSASSPRMQHMSCFASPFSGAVVPALPRASVPPSSPDVTHPDSPMRFFDEFINMPTSGRSSPAMGLAPSDVREVTSMADQQISTVQRPPPLSGSLVRNQRLRARYHLDNLPWIRYRLSLQAMRSGGTQTVATTRQYGVWSLAVMPADGFFEHSYPGLPVLISDTSFPTAFDVDRYASSSKALATHFDPYHTLAQVVYLFSNNLQSNIDDEDMIQLLDTLAGGGMRNLVFKMFAGGELSIRALWERLFEIAFKYTAKSGLQLLIGIGLELHPDWVDERIDDIVFAAVYIGDTPLLQELLKERPSWNSGSRKDPTYFSAAAHRGAVDCAEILLTRCDPNARTLISILSPTGEPTSIFIEFLHELSYHTGQPAYAEIFSLFVAAGADIDTPYPYCVNFGRLEMGWKLTCLDFCAYTNIGMPTEASLSSYSHTYNSMFTRAGICDALSEGQGAVAKYLESMRPPHGLKPRNCLRAILIEQFEVLERRRWANASGASSQITQHPVTRVRALLEYGVSMRAWRTWSPSDALGSILESVSSHREKDITYVLNKAVEAGACIDWYTYPDNKTLNDLAALKTLVSHDADVAVNGRGTLLNAAAQGSFEVVALLLEKGVSVNSELLRRYDYSDDAQATLIAHLLTSWGHDLHDDWQDDIREKRKMWRYLIKHGAELRLKVGHATCFQLLRAIICSPSSHQWHAFRFVLKYDKDISHVSSSRWIALLDVAAKQDGVSFPIIKTLFRRCGSSSEPLLARAIMSGCNLAFVEELVDAGEDVNVFSGGDYMGILGQSPLQAAASLLDVEMVARLLELGAEINSPTPDEARTPAFQLALRPSDRAHKEDVLARVGMTALQLACSCCPDTLETMEQRGRLIKLLVNHGADINASAHDQYTSTALQLLCRRVPHLPSGSRHVRELIRFFIDKGADVNIAPAFSTFTALQECAQRGDIELAVLLVESGADPNAYPSFDPGHHTTRSCKSALDMAAREGRLDMTQYLLNIGALSISPGNTGYQGALDLAIEMKYHAVAEIIRIHTEKMEQEFQLDAGLRARHSELINRHAAAKRDREAELARFLDFRMFS